MLGPFEARKGPTQLEERNPIMNANTLTSCKYACSHESEHAVSAIGRVRPLAASLVLQVCFGMLACVPMHRLVSNLTFRWLATR